MKLKLFIFSAFTFLLIGAHAQFDKTLALAKQYYQTGDYEKSAKLFEELWKDNNQNLYYYTSLYNSYIRLNDYAHAEQLVKKQVKRNKDDLSYKIDLGYIYSQNNESAKAEDIYKDVISLLPDNQTFIRSTAAKFIGVRQLDYAIECYLKGRELLKDKSLFGFELGNVYLQGNKIKEAVGAYLHLMNENTIYKNSVQSILTNNIEKEGLQDELEEQLYSLVQKNSAKTEYLELLIWLFTHQADYEQALIQAKALDKRNQEDGGRIIQLANDAIIEQQYDAAIEAFIYVQSKGKVGRFFQLAKSGEIESRKLKITNTLDYSNEDIATLQQEYETFLSNYGKNVSTVNSMQELAKLQAYYVHDIAAAIQLMEELLAIPNLPKKTKNLVKLDLGDFYVLFGDVWEATLLYAQVDKDEKDSPIGEDARFRNSKLSYFKGEFEWAQAQLGILKGATTELIANNALKLSIFILDNLGLDTTTATMQMYADADLLHIQNKDQEALSLLGDILIKYPGHALTDDIYYKQAQILLESQKFEKANTLLKLLFQDFSEDILADNALFLLGEVYQKYLDQPDKAMEYYKIIITDYTNSVLMVEARKRFRFLRGDDV
tara:strand:+ start:10271 stop:12082 length:1812 start_codon:yes stop_codon:yes gene_type:complete